MSNYPPNQPPPGGYPPGGNPPGQPPGSPPSGGPPPGGNPPPGGGGYPPGGGGGGYPPGGGGGYPPGGGGGYPPGGGGGGYPPSGGYPPGGGGGYPPGGGGYPPGGGYQQSGGGYRGQPGGYGAPPPKKKWPWVLGGCFALLVMGAVGVVAFFYWAAHKAVDKAKQAGFDTELMQKNPTLAAAKMVVALNPDLEVVSSDDDKGTLTVKNKKTGEVVTMDAEDIKDGKLSFKKEGKDGGSVEFNAGSGSDSPSLKVKTDQGTATFGAGSAGSLPEWLPAYPGASPQWLGSTHDAGQHIYGGEFNFKTSDMPNQIQKFYNDAFESAGLRVMVGGLPDRPSVIGTSKDNKRSCIVNIVQQGDESQVDVAFKTEE